MFSIHGEGSTFGTNHRGGTQVGNSNRFENSPITYNVTNIFRCDTPRLEDEWAEERDKVARMEERANMSLGLSTTQLDDLNKKLQILREFQTALDRELNRRKHKRSRDQEKREKVEREEARRKGDSASVFPPSGVGFDGSSSGAGFGVRDQERGNKKKRGKAQRKGYEAPGFSPSGIGFDDSSSRVEFGERGQRQFLGQRLGTSEKVFAEHAAWRSPGSREWGFESEIRYPPVLYESTEEQWQFEHSGCPSSCLCAACNCHDGGRCG